MAKGVWQMNGSYFDGDLGNGSPVLEFPVFTVPARARPHVEAIRQPAPAPVRELAFA